MSASLDVKDREAERGKCAAQVYFRKYGQEAVLLRSQEIDAVWTNNPYAVGFRQEALRVAGIEERT